jgi:hypothetical protein
LVVDGQIINSRQMEPGSNVTVKATDDVYIKNGFEVKKGATFTTIPAE